MNYYFISHEKPLHASVFIYPPFLIFKSPGALAVHSGIVFLAI